jgi:hypothetical protein
MVMSPDEAGAPMIAHRILGGAVVPVLAAEGQDIGTLTRLTESR